MLALSRAPVSLGLCALLLGGCYESHTRERAPEPPPDAGPPVVPIACTPGTIATRWVTEWGGPSLQSSHEVDGFVLVPRLVDRDAALQRVDLGGRLTIDAPLVADRSRPWHEWFHRGDALWLARYGDGRFQAGPYARGRGFVPTFDASYEGPLRGVGALDDERLVLATDRVDDPARFVVVDFEGRVLEPRRAHPDEGPFTYLEGPDGYLRLVSIRRVGDDLELRVGRGEGPLESLYAGSCPDDPTCFQCCAYGVQALADDLYAWSWRSPSFAALFVGRPGEEPSASVELDRPDEIGSVWIARSPDGTVVVAVERNLGTDDFEVTLRAFDRETLSERATGTLPESELAPERLLSMSSQTNAGAFVLSVDRPSDDGREPRWMLGRVCLP